MKNSLAITALISSTFLAGPAFADSSITSSISVLTFETGGTTYTGAVASTAELEFDFSQNLYGNIAVTYVTASGADAVGLGAGLGYLFRDDINLQNASGMRLGAGLYLGGLVELNAAMPLSQDLIADVAIATPVNGFGDLFTYGIGVEYAPLGIYANYMDASFTDYDLSLNGFGIGYRSHF